MKRLNTCFCVARRRRHHHSHLCQQQATYRTSRGRRRSDSDSEAHHPSPFLSTVLPRRQSVKAVFRLSSQQVLDLVRDGQRRVSITQDLQDAQFCVSDQRQSSSNHFRCFRRLLAVILLNTSLILILLTFSGLRP